jgi:hypothetical protein
MTSGNEHQQIDPLELRLELVRRGWTRKMLAEKAGLSVRWTQLIVRGLPPGPNATLRILNALGHDGAARVCYEQG